MRQVWEVNHEGFGTPMQSELLHSGKQSSENYSSPEKNKTEYTNDTRVYQETTEDRTIRYTMSEDDRGWI